MIPGRTSKLSESSVAIASSIDAKTDVVILTGSGTVTLNTIIPNFGGGFGGFVILVPTGSATHVLGTAGNILVGITMAQNRAVMLTYVRSLGKWIIENGV